MRHPDGSWGQTAVSFFEPGFDAAAPAEEVERALVSALSAVQGLSAMQPGLYRALVTAWWHSGHTVGTQRVASTQFMITG
jgi:hypothetical protein